MTDETTAISRWRITLPQEGLILTPVRPAKACRCRENQTRAAARPAARPVAHAHEKLWPPIGPKASRISPQRYSPATLRLSNVLGSTSPRATPPPVTSAFL